MTYALMNTGVPWSLVKGGFHKSPGYKTLKQETVTGRGDGAIALRPFPVWAFEVDLNLVSGGEAVQASVLQWFLGCFMATYGGAGLFLFTDPNDNTVVNNSQSCLIAAPSGSLLASQLTGDGSTTQFQLGRKIDQGLDVIQQVSNVNVYVNGTLATGVTVSDGMVTFASAPAAGATLTWSGSFQYLCRFTDDTLKDLARTSKNQSGFLWSCPSISFESRYV